jgi:hypothetical protein
MHLPCLLDFDWKLWLSFRIHESDYHHCRSFFRSQRNHGGCTDEGVPPWLLFECKIEEIEGYSVLCRRSREFAVPFSPRAVVSRVPLTMGYVVLRVRSIS